MTDLTDYVKDGGKVTIYAEGQRTTKDKKPMPVSLNRRFGTKRTMRLVQRHGISRTGDFPQGYAAMNWNKIGTNY